MTSGNGKVAIFCSSLYCGGAERAMLNLASGFANRGLAVDLVLAQAEGPFLADVPPSVRIVDLRARRVVASLPALVRYLRRERPKVLLSALDRVNVVAILAKYISRVSPRTIVSIHSPVTFSFKTQKTFIGRQVIRGLAILTYPKADMVVTVSQGVKRDLMGLMKLREEKVRTIYNPIINPLLYRWGLENVSHPWFEPQQPPVLLAVGRLTADKDYPTLLRAFQRVRQRRPARLMILGEGEDRFELESLVRELGLEKDVALPGFARNPYSLMKKAACFILSSTFEGFGNVLVEALAMGCPVVSTDCPGGPAEILDGGVWGKMVPMGDDESLAAAILASMGSKNNYDPALLRSYLRRFGEDEVISKYIDILFPGGAGVQ